MGEAAKIVTKAIPPPCKYLVPLDCNQSLLLANLSMLAGLAPAK